MSKKTKKKKTSNESVEPILTPEQEAKEARHIASMLEPKLHEKRVLKEPLVRLREVDITFGTGRKANKAVKDVTFDVFKGETFGLVGESGSGKTTIGRAVMGIQPISDGTIYFKDRVARGHAPDLEDLTSKIERNFEIMMDNQNAATVKINNYLEEYKRVYYKYLYSKFYDFKTKELKDYPDGRDRRIPEGVNIKDTKLVNIKKEANLKFISITIKDNLKRLIKAIRLLQKTIQFTDGLNDFIDIDKSTVDAVTRGLKDAETDVFNIKDLENQVYKHLEDMNKIREDAVNGDYTSISKFLDDLGNELKKMISIHKSISTYIAISQKKFKTVVALTSRNKHRQKWIKWVDEKIKKAQDRNNKLTEQNYEEVKAILQKESITDAVEKSKIFKDPTKKETKDLKMKMQMIFQDPASSLNDHLPVEQIIGEGLSNFPEIYKNKETVDAYVNWYNKDKEPNRQIDASQVKYRDVKHYLIAEMVKAVGMLPEHLSRYPHEFSGGQRQRIGIARALVMRPEFIVADEPISALDASIRAQVINLLTKFQKEYDLTYIFIAHDLSIVHFIADRIAVLYHGDIVELADADELFNHPLHPYTKSLLSAVPLPDPEQEKNKVHFVYEPEKEHYDYLVDFPVWREISPNHFVYANNREYAEMQKALKKQKEQSK